MIPSPGDRNPHARRPHPRAWRLLAGAGAALALATPVSAAAPRPLPTPRGLVSDFAGVIAAPIAARIDGRLSELQQKTGAEIAVVTVDTTAPDDVFDYAIRLAEAWKPGAAGKDNGVLFVTAVRDRAMHVLVGYGLEGALPDGLVGEIRDRAVLPRFRAGDYGGGILAGSEQLAAGVAAEYGVTLSGTPVPRLAPPPRGRTSGFPLVLMMLLFFVILPNLRLLGPPGRRRRGLWMAGPMWGTGFGGGGFGGSGGGFGGFGGGGFGGGGAGGRW